MYCNTLVCLAIRIAHIIGINYLLALLRTFTVYYGEVYNVSNMNSPHRILITMSNKAFTMEHFFP